MIVRPYCVDFDDLCDYTADKLDMLPAIKRLAPQLLVTLYTIPQRTSPATIERAKSLGPWIQLAPHGWRHTRGECLAWTSEEAVDKLTLARDKGIDAPIFRAPGWLCDAEIYNACAQLNYAMASHRRFRIAGSSVREYIYNQPNLHKSKFTAVHGHLTATSGNYIDHMVGDGSLNFYASDTFVFPQVLAQVMER